MPNIEIKKTKYYKCPYCHRIIPDYVICNCVKIYNQALKDFVKKCDEAKYIVFEQYTVDMRDIRKIEKELSK